MQQENSIQNAGQKLRRFGDSQSAGRLVNPCCRRATTSDFVLSFSLAALASETTFMETGNGGLEITIEEEDVALKALLTIPSDPKGVVIFAHGSGSGRHSPRNQYVSHVLNQSGFVTILADLLMEDESGDRNKVFDIDLLADRLSLITNWVDRHPRLSRLNIGYFGASTGAAAAVQAAAENRGRIQAVVSRGGRPDLAMEFLGDVEAATLLVVGSLDDQVIELNRVAYDLLECEKEFEIVPGATHLFEEPGKLELVAHLAARWFERHLMLPRPSMGRPEERPSHRI